MTNRRSVRNGLAWLEILLAIAILALILQLFPNLGRALDVRNWTRGVWFLVNGLVVIALILIRFAPDQVLEWQSRRGRTAADHKILERQRAAREHRESLEQIRKARKRRLY
jgi:hypothetical protein